MTRNWFTTFCLLPSTPFLFNCCKSHCDKFASVSNNVIQSRNAVGKRELYNSWILSCAHKIE